VVNPLWRVPIAPVITVVIGSAHAGDRVALFELVEAATRTDSTGMARNNVGLPLPAISQVTVVDDQFGTHSERNHRLGVGGVGEPGWGNGITGGD